MIYCIDPSAEEPIMLINTHIGFDAEDGQGINGALFQNELLQLDAMGKKRIQIWINSLGGVVMDGYNICSAILKTKADVDTCCIGAAASIAGVIFMMGRKRTMIDYAWLMVHLPSGGSDKILDVITESLVKAIAGRTGIGEEVIKIMMAAETYITATDALAKGFCTKIEPSEDYNKRYMTEATTAEAKWKVGNKILNKIFNKEEKNKSMDKLTNHLDLAEGTEESKVLNAIKMRENAFEAKILDLEKAKNIANKAVEDKNEELEKMKKERDKAKADYEEMNDKYEKASAKVKDAEAKAKDAEEKREEEDCRNMVTKYAGQGRIKNDKETIDKWVSNAKKLGKAETEDMLKALPLNKTAPRIPVTETNKEVTTNVIAQKMRELQEKQDKI